MNELAAKKYATQLAERWPGHILASVDVPSNRTDEQGYVVRLTIPRRNRVLKLTREVQLSGILDVCAALLDLPPASTSTVDDIKEEQAMSIEQAEQHETEITTAPVDPAKVILSEEESSGYLGVKINTIRTYTSNGALGRLSEAPRSWKVDVTTERGPESYRVTRNVDGSFAAERW